jgi:peptidoglycan/LPS O-acetylase OafA/YrhL
MEPNSRSTRRNVQFDLFRIIFAILVLLSHAPEITDGNPSRELFYRMTHQHTFGDLAVDGFFLLSGYLIVQSWASRPQLSAFLKKRALRIIPGYMFAALLSTLVVGSLAPAAPLFFRNLGGTFVASVIFLTSPLTPPAYPGLPYSIVNGALWTIAYEFRCYLLVALLGALGLVRRSMWLGACALLFVFMLDEHLQHYFLWHGFLLVMGVPEFFFRFTPIFFLGGCFYFFKDKIPFRALLAILAAAGFFLLAPQPRISEAAMAICGGYLLFYLGSKPFRTLQGLRFPDISYGVYLYGWPVESLWIWYFHGSPWVTFLGSTIICCGLGWLSWHFVERPALTLKRNSSAPLPVA